MIDFIIKSIEAIVDPVAETVGKLFKNRVFVGLFLLLAMIGTFTALIIALLSEKEISPSKTLPVTILIATTTVVVIASSMLRYLEQGRRREKRAYVTAHEMAAMMARIDNLNEIQRMQLGPEERKMMLEKVEARWDKDFQTDLFNDFGERFGQQIKEQLASKAMSDLFSALRSRLMNEVESLERRGNLNLVLGILTTLIGLITLGVFLFLSPESMEVGPILSHYLPRITLVIFIQLFGFFFLKLYKSSLEGMKYFQNELTNIEIKYLAFVAALNSGNAKSVASILASLSKTERNFILLKGQTTVEIEKTKLESEQYKDIISAVNDLGKKNGQLKR